MAKRLLLIVCCIALLAGAAAWIWSLGRVAAEEDSGAVTLRVDSPPVDVRSGNGEWAEAEDGMALEPLDEVRTGIEGRATISFYGEAETRLGEGSHIILRESSYLAEGSPRLIADIQLVTGRVWSRVLQLFDLGSAFSVRTDSVVATVRGTAFDVALEDGGTRISVSESRVEAVNASDVAGEAGVIVPEGWTAKRGGDGTWGKIQKWDDTDKQGEWVRWNETADTRFREQTRTRYQGRYNGRAAGRLNQLVGRAVSLSERLHFMFEGENRPRLYARYLGRRLYGIKQLVDEGKTGLAMQSFASVEKEVLAEIRKPGGKITPESVRAVVVASLVYLEDVEPSEPLYRVKQRLEDLEQSLDDADTPGRMFGHFRAVGSRLKETVRLIRQNALEEAEVTLGTAERGIENGTRDLERIGGALSAEDRHALASYLRALKTHAEIIRGELTVALQNPPEEQPAREAGDLVPTSTGAIPPTAPVGTPSATSPITRIVVSAQPNPIEVGGTSQMTVTAYREDGTTGNVTGQATYAVLGSIGYLAGSVYHGDSPGSVTVEASVTDGGSTLSGQTTVTTNAPQITLLSLQVIPQGSTTVLAGSILPLVAEATYSDNSKKIVTGVSAWSVSDTAVGSVDGGTFFAASKGTGTVRVTATYSERGVTRSHSATLTVVLR